MFNILLLSLYLSFLFRDFETDFSIITNSFVILFELNFCKAMNGGSLVLIDLIVRIEKSTTHILNFCKFGSHVL